MNKVIVWVLFVFAILVVYFVINESLYYKYSGYFLIEKIEEYKLKNKRLPKSLWELNVETGMGEGPYYEMIDSTKYEVYFNIGFDDILIYSSDTKEWKETP